MSISRDVCVCVYVCALECILPTLTLTHRHTAKKKSMSNNTLPQRTNTKESQQQWQPTE